MGRGRGALGGIPQPVESCAPGSAVGSAESGAEAEATGLDPSVSGGRARQGEDEVRGRGPSREARDRD